MGKPRSHFPIMPRGMNAHETADYIGVGDSKFAEMRRSGEFDVQPLPYGTYWDRRAVDRWLDAFGREDPAESPVDQRELNDLNAETVAKVAEDAWIRAARNG